MAIRFTLNGGRREESSVSPTMTVLDYLREKARLSGTKDGGGEGDCGACTIAIVRHGCDRLEAVNACLLAMGQIDGARITTVEGLAARDGTLDPVQAAVVAEDGTQCGFCTPGFVMALYALRLSGEAVDDETIHDALAGNLCRCTGYRSIVAAARNACKRLPGGSDRHRTADDTAPTASETYDFAGQRFFAPRSLDALIARRSEFPDAHLLAGGLHFVRDAEQLLHVMADLVRNHVSLSEISGRAKARAQLIEEAEVDIKLLVARAVERSHRCPTEAAG